MLDSTNRQRFDPRFQPFMQRHVAVFLYLVCVASLLGEPRQPWTTSRIKGSPEPSKPFVAEQLLSELRFVEGIELAAVPGTDRLLLIERGGKISSFRPRDGAKGLEEVLNLRPLHPRLDHTFAAALHPRFRETREFYVCYVMPTGQKDGSRVSRFKLTSLDPLRADPASEEVVITWLSGGHNGCSLQFGPDGFLYVSTGDSGPAAPPDLHNTGQDVSDLSGGILRLDVDRRDAGKNYRVPPDNPWVDREGVRPELWSYGLRNPWRMSFDPANGNLWCGDIGWELWEMIYLIKRGANYGWSAYEASQPVKPQLLNPLSPITPPVVAHPHSEAASITGGFVYHGKQYPELAGAYVYGDFATGKIWALWHDGSQLTRHEEIADTPHAIIAFGCDDEGELYYLHYAREGTLHRLVRNQRATPGSDFPRRLSATELFSDVAAQKPAPGVYPFSVATPIWQDGAVASRFVALPDRTGIEASPQRRRRNEYEMKWPAGSVLARTIRLGALAIKETDRQKPIETQVLHYDGEAWNAYSYRWNDEATDAELVPVEGADRVLKAAADPNALGSGSRDYTWRFSSRAECLRCHSTWHNGALGFTAMQFHRSPEQVQAFVEAGIVDANFAAHTAEAGKMAAEIGRAREILHANCAACHSINAGGSVPIFLNASTPPARMNTFDVVPTQGGLGLKEPKIVDPGRPWNSVLALRMAKTGAGHMPLVGSRDVDVEGLKVIEDWIAAMPTNKATASALSFDRVSLERELATVGGAMRVRRAIDDNILDASQRELAFKLAWASPEQTVRDIFDRFKPDELRERTLGSHIDPSALLRLRGEPANGAKLLAVEGKLASCQACHVMRGQGRHVGPDLSRIGAQQTPAQILESVLTPSKVVAPLFRTTLISQRDGSTHMGFVRARGATELVVAGIAGVATKVKLSDIVNEETQLTSLMPEGLFQGLTPQEAADVVAYLASLK